ncbi:single-stranded DNA-binding protein [Pseudonocardia hispaniensis]|uniref:Single-stranded DNA-binding protein n=1 Tax=Pseudonocardia hispaniensis TaxID=904933 RepID=A0ABW1J316_9PSEU
MKRRCRSKRRQTRLDPVSQLQTRESAMSDIWTTVVGNIATGINRRRTADGVELASFRVASNERRLDRASGTWTTTGTTYVSVTVWRALAQKVGASFVKGDPVIVYGRLSTRDYEDRGGHQRTDVSIDAHAVGPDLTWCTAALARTSPRTSSAPLDHAGDLGDERPHTSEADEADPPNPADPVSGDGNGHLVGVLPGGRT